MCAVKDVCSNRIVGYSIDTRMTSGLAVKAVERRRKKTCRRSRPGRRYHHGTATTDPREGRDLPKLPRNVHDKSSDDVVHFEHG